MAQKTHNEEDAVFKIVKCSKCNSSSQKCFATSSLIINHKSFPSTSSIKLNPPQRTKEGPSPPSLVKNEVNRCSGCLRKVGLTGFRCRCGELFCADHRYSDRHDCSYDYKTIGREAISRENPVVKASKIVKF